MRKLLAVVFLSAIFSLNAFAVTVTFQDAALEAAVRAAINNPSGVITAKSLKDLDALIVPGLGISSLVGLEYCVNLRVLDISNNSVTDLSPIAGLIKLRELNISNNDISDISALSGMDKMKVLNIENNTIVDISAIAGMVKIKSLDLSGNQITDLTPLLENPGIKGKDIIDISYNPISDPTQIATLGINVTFVPPSSTATPTFTDTFTFTFTETPTYTFTETPTETFTETYTETYTGTPTPTDTPACVNIPDPVLELEIRRRLNKPTGDIYPQDLEAITYLKLYNAVDLTGIQYCVNLTRLDAKGNLTDISLIAGLNKINLIDLSGSQVSDISPLAGLTELTSVYLQNMPVSDISVLTALPKLTVVNLGYSNVSDLSPLSGMTGVKTIRAGGTRVTDISSIAGMTWLENLDVSENNISNLAAVIPSLTGLKFLEIISTNTSDISFIGNLPNLERLTADYNGISDIDVLAGMQKLTGISLSSNSITSVAALVANPSLAGGSQVILRGNPLSYDAYYTEIPVLLARGVVVFADNPPATYTPTPSFTDTFTLTFTETPTPTFTDTYTPTFTYSPTVNPATCWTDFDGSGIESINMSLADGNTATFPKVVIDRNGVPAIIWREEHSGSQGVMGQLYYRKWNGSAWADINGRVPGNAQITNESTYIGAYYYFDMEFGTDNNPNIIFRRPSSTGNSNVFMKWNGRAWVGIDGTTGESILPMAANVFMGKNQLSIDSRNNPHVSWCTNNRINYLKWNGTAWVDADGTGIESASIADMLVYDPSLALDANDRPCISFNSLSTHLGFLRWNGSAWVDADGAGTESMNIYPCQMSVNMLKLDTNGNPCIGFTPYQYFNYIRWNGSAWTDADGIGTESVTVNLPEGVSFGSLCLDPSNNPYISYTTGSQMTTAGIVRWNGSAWTDVDGSGLESRVIGMFPDPWGGSGESIPDMAIDKYGILHVVSAPAYRYVYYLRNACYTYPAPAAPVQGADVKTAITPVTESLAADSTYSYPNPCRDSATIRFVLAAPAETRIGISDINGKPVWSVSLGLNETRSGINSIVWNTVNDNGVEVSNGTYFVTVASEGKTVTKKLAVSR